MTRSLRLSEIKLTDPFFAGFAELVRREVIPYQWETLNDRVPDAVSSNCMRNFRVAAKQLGHGFEDEPADKFGGFCFQDTDFYKWIEAVGYSLEMCPDEELMRLADEAIDTVCAAQDDDGYFDTFYIIGNRKNERFTNLRDNHELYCLGHMIEGAIAYFNSTGHDKFLKAACRYADHVADRFGEGEGKLRGYPGHEIAELALVKLYQLTGVKRYLELAEFFINERGRNHPHYFAKEHGEKDPEEGSWRYEYQQAHKPVREQDEAWGHAVRAVYLYAGMAALAKENGDDSLHEACRKIWDNIERKKIYITGGIGASPVGEAFSYDYYLPNNIMYNETCASIGLVFFARRMLELEINSRYADVMETALYNGILSGMAADGKAFFYVNPLEFEPEGKRDAYRQSVSIGRQKWFGCACCPPNLARLLSSVGEYAYGKDEDTFYVHLYAAGDIHTQVGDKCLDLSIKGNYPWEDTLEFTFGADYSGKLALRVPKWCGKIVVNGETVAREDCENGYYVISGGKAGETITVKLPMKPKFIRANNRVRSDIGQIALMRGPVVYCVEEADNGAMLHLCEVDTSEEPVEIGGEEVSDILAGTVCLKARGYRTVCDSEEELYSDDLDCGITDTRLTYIPYYLWSNRGVGEMRVYLRRNTK